MGSPRPDAIFIVSIKGVVSSKLLQLSLAKCISFIKTRLKIRIARHNCIYSYLESC